MKVELEKQRQAYIQALYELVDLKGDCPKDKLISFYTEYCKFCYENNLSTYDRVLENKGESIFIIDEKPIDYVIDKEQKEKALLHLKSVLQHRKEGQSDGISMEEADLILQSTVQSARLTLAREEASRVDFFEASLDGCCGYSQALTAFPLLDLGVDITINNVNSLPDCVTRHSYITCTLPINEEEQTIEKDFLIDATYRQFFILLRCNEGRFYEGDERFKDKCGPDCGYYLATEEGISFAKSLLSRGYMELTEYNAKMYGTAFSAMSINRSTTKEQVQTILGHSGREYIDAMHHEMIQEGLDYSPEEILENKGNISLFSEIGTIQDLLESEKRETM